MAALSRMSTGVSTSLGSLIVPLIQTADFRFLKFQLRFDLTPTIYGLLTSKSKTVPKGLKSAATKSRRHQGKWELHFSLLSLCAFVANNGFSSELPDVRIMTDKSYREISVVPQEFCLRWWACRFAAIRCYKFFSWNSCLPFRFGKSAVDLQCRGNFLYDILPYLLTIRITNEAHSEKYDQ